MHYALFSVEDRFCATAAWLLAPRLGIETARLSPALCAIETLRCSLLFKARSNNAFEPALAEAASYGLIPLAFEIATVSKQIEVMRILARAASPVHLLSALHKESTLYRPRYRSREEVIGLLREKVTPAFCAVGEALALFATTKEKAELLPEWFRKLGLFAHWVDELTNETDSRTNPLALRSFMTMPEAIELIKSVETELLEGARELGIKVAAHEIIEPLADTLKARLQ